MSPRLSSQEIRDKKHQFLTALDEYLHARNMASWYGPHLEMDPSDHFERAREALGQAFVDAFLTKND